MTGALANAAALAGYAPSIHNTQPWRWQVSENTLDLFAVHSRQLAITDPEGRLALLRRFLSVVIGRMSRFAADRYRVPQRIFLQG